MQGGAETIALGAFFALSTGSDGSESAPEVAVSPALDTVIDRLSPEVAEMVRHGAITYWTSPDNSEYEVGVYPPNAVSLPR